MASYIRRRKFLATLAGAAATWPPSALAQHAGKLATIGFLGSNATAWGPWTAAFVARLRELDWIEGRTVVIEHRWTEGRPKRAAEIAAELVRRKVDVIVTSGTAVVVAAMQATSVIPLALAARLPTMHGTRDYVEAGGLMSYGTNFPDLFRRAADYVDKILRGAKPADLPVEQPTKFDLVINLTTAKALGLTIPESFLLRADEVIE